MHEHDLDAHAIAPRKLLERLGACHGGVVVAHASSPSMSRRAASHGGAAPASTTDTRPGSMGSNAPGRGVHAAGTSGASTIQTAVGCSSASAIYTAAPP